MYWSNVYQRSFPALSLSFFILSVIDLYVYHDVHMMLIYTSTYICCKREDIHVKVKAHKVKPLAFHDLRCYFESGKVSFTNKLIFITSSIFICHICAILVKPP